jgi:hypothetical protein
MSYVIYKSASNGDPCERWYLTDIPSEDNVLGGIGYQGGKAGNVPRAAGTTPTEEDANKVCEYLRTACYGPPEDHFYEKAPAEVTP